MATAKSIGTTTGDQITWTPGFVNAIDAGAIGDASTDNLALFQMLLNDGKSIYLPPGYPGFAVRGQILLQGKSDIGIFGAGKDSRLLQLDQDENLFRLEDTHGFSIRNLTAIGYLEQTGYVPPPNISTAKQSLVLALDGSDLVVTDNYIQGWCAYTVQARGVDRVRIQNNTFTKCEQYDQATAGADIHVIDNNGSHPKEITITGNTMQTNLKVGIQCSLGLFKRAVIANNIIIGMDKDGNEPTATLNRVHGITLSYSTDEMNSDDQQEVAVTGNVIRNVGWSGVYINGLSDTAVDVGTRAIVNGNHIDLFGQRVTGDALLAGGVNCIHYRRVTIVNNQIRSCDDDRIAAIRLNAQAAGNRAIVMGNDIDNVACQGISVSSRAGEVLVANNRVSCGKEALYAYSSSSEKLGKFTINGNQFIREGGDLDLVILNYTNPTGEADAQVIVTNNLFEQIGDTATTNHYLLYLRNSFATITGNRFVGPGGAAASVMTGVRWGIAPTGRGVDHVVSNNFLSGLRYGYTMTGMSGLAGPVVVDGQFKDVQTEINSGGVYLGQVNGDTVRAKTSSSAAPTSGSWVNGDVVERKSPVVGQPWYWVYAGGAWVAGPNL